MSRNGESRVSYVADFETTTTPDDCRVWAWGLCKVLDNLSLSDVEIGHTLLEFIDRISTEESICYFHNLAFDGGFIMDWLLKEGYRHVEEHPQPGQFTTLISDMGRHYSIKVNWVEGEKTEFRDSLNKLPFSVDRIAKAFKLEHHKLEIDYELPRPIGYQMTPHEEMYVASDVIIVAQALHTQLSQGMKKLTVGSDSLFEFKNLFGLKRFERLFPILPAGIDTDVRTAYRGGWTYVKDDIRGELIEADGAVYDANSLYPSVMADELMPYGEAHWFTGDPEVFCKWSIYVVSITFTASLRPGRLPCIQVKGHSIFNSVEYVHEIDEPITLSVTNVDLGLWQEQYDLDILSFNGGWGFQSVSGVFDEYIDKWFTVKQTSEGALREIAKLHLNSLYGKFATNPRVVSKIPVLEGDYVKLQMLPEETRDPVYTPVGVLITAYARATTIRAAQANYEQFLYADTDSLHLSTRKPPAGVTVHDTALSCWKHETDFVRAKYLRPKRYIEELSDGKLDIHIAGLPHNVYDGITFDNFIPGKTFDGKLIPRRVPGGIILQNTTFTLN